MRFTVDASVHLNALSPHEEGSQASQEFIDRIHRPATGNDPVPHEVYSPTLLLTEVAAAAARVLDDTGQSLALARAVHGLPRQTWVNLDEDLASQAAEIGARYRLRGADAVYCAVARSASSVRARPSRRHREGLKQAPAVDAEPEPPPESE